MSKGFPDHRVSGIFYIRLAHTWFQKELPIHTRKIKEILEYRLERNYARKVKEILEYILQLEPKDCSRKKDPSSYSWYNHNWYNWCYSSVVHLDLWYTINHFWVDRMSSLFLLQNPLWREFTFDPNPCKSLRCVTDKTL